MTVEVKIGVQHASRELSIETDAQPDQILADLKTATEAGSGVLTLTNSKGQTVVVPADKIAYLFFTEDNGRKVGFLH